MTSLRALAIGPGKTFEFKELSLAHKAAISLAMKEGDDKVDQVSGQRNEKHQRLERRLVLWRPRFYKGNWLKRAGAAKAGCMGTMP